MANDIYGSQAAPVPKRGRRIWRFGGFEVRESERLKSVRHVYEGGKPKPVSNEVFDFLLLLLEEPGAYVTGRAAAERVWQGADGGSNFSAQIARPLRALLGEGIFQPGKRDRGYRLQIDNLVIKVEDAIGSAGGAGASTLVGREADMADLERALQDGRLVTITGAVGVGKRTLAKELRRAWGERPGCSVRHVEVSLATSKDELQSALRKAIGHTGIGDASQIGQSLQGEGWLLVLDHCQHLKNDVAAVCKDLLEASNGLRIVATSTVKLGLRSLEALLDLKPLVSLPLKTVSLAE